MQLIHKILIHGTVDVPCAQMVRQIHIIRHIVRRLLCTQSKTIVPGNVMMDIHYKMASVSRGNRFFAVEHKKE